MGWGVMLTTAKPVHLTEREILLSTIEYVQAAEHCGFDSAWVLEHHFTPYGLCPDTLSMAAFLLGQTTKIHIGTAVVIAPLLHPLRIAETAALLDQISDGRFHLGLGRGGFPTDFEVFGVDATQTHIHLRESLHLIIEAWTKELVEGPGPTYQFSPVRVYPKPLSKPHPPIYIAGESPPTVEWAAKNAFPLLIELGPSDEETRSRMELYAETAEMAGHNPEAIEHVIACVGYIADSREEAKKAVSDDLVWWVKEASNVGFQVDHLQKLPNYRFHLRRIEQAVLAGNSSGDFGVSKWLDRNPVGTAEQCIERLEEIIEISGAHHVILGIEGAGSRQLTKDNIARFASEVIPHVTNARMTQLL